MGQPVPRKWTLRVFYALFLYFGFCWIALLEIPVSMWDPELRKFTLLIGALGVWRYCWWFTHAVRAEIYQRWVFPVLRRRSDALWQGGSRPSRVHILLTTLLERRRTTEMVMQSIVCEARLTRIPITVWLGSGDRYDEDLMVEYLRQHAGGLDLDFVIVRQTTPGKRAAIGLLLRALCRKGVRRDELAILMDGDSILAPGVLRRCCPLFAADPELQALTTDEESVVLGPRWMQVWLTMRFAQRRMAMQSHALSGKVLTLTGRMSMFRASVLTDLEFIRMVEADHLDHWLWGRFRFLSGDDKSTWYSLLSRGARMLYVPDALVYTVDVVEGQGLDRMISNLRRWSGNMLRTGVRAIALGPRKVGPFIWWCLIDQRISMWTMLVSPLIAGGVSLIHAPAYFLAYVVWIAISRMLLSLFLYRYCTSVHISFPLFLYAHQLMSAVIKVYSVFRLAKQRWSHRGGQVYLRHEDWHEIARNWMANYVTAVWVGAFVLATSLYSTLLESPSMRVVITLLKSGN